jgi:DNA-directed RNA polymerase subunit alpha
MIPLSQPTKIVESKQNKGVFVVEGLYPGYGITVGNSLRRVLLSSLEGGAVTQVKIKGVSHEFATMPGVLEDVITIILNIKQLRFRMYENEPQKATLKVKGEREVTAGDFELPASLKLINPELLLATLTEKSTELEMEIQVEKGIGYVPAEQHKKEKQEIGSIALDAIFTPVRRVSSRVENMRVGDRTDFDRLTLEIETDGTVTPEGAFYQAVDVLLKQLEIVKSGVQEVAEAALVSGEQEEVAEKKPKRATKKKTTKATKTSAKKTAAAK